jgi:hypothetical protein
VRGVGWVVVRGVTSNGIKWHQMASTAASTAASIIASME